MPPASEDKKQAPIKVLLVEDHDLLRRGLRILIEANARYKVCGEADSASAAVELAVKLKPDLALVDLTLKGSGGGFELLRELKRLLPDLPSLVLSLHSEDMYAASALKAGARGYLKKEDAKIHLDEAMEAILSGKVWLSDLMRRSMPEFL